ncbi:MAG: WxL domain-containing protein [Lactobacillales bacterium]|nr:WxL domain-containing protein [Lactobacillales bacterium]
MKKLTIATAIMSGALLSAGLAPTALADTTTGASDGTVAFLRTDEIPEIIVPKPGPTPDSKPGPVIDVPGPPVDSVPVVDGLILLFVPDFDFGVNTISISDATYYAEKNYVAMGEPDSKFGSGDIIAVPQFAQVGDYSGDAAKDFKLTVVQDAQFQHTTTGHVLKKTHIEVDGFTAVNNSYTKTQLAANFPGLTVPGARTIPITGTPITVLNHDGSRDKAGEATNGTITSTVFKKNYVYEDDALLIANGTDSRIGTAGLTTALFGDEGKTIKDETDSGIVGERRALLLEERDSVRTTGVNKADKTKNYDVRLVVPRVDNVQRGRYNTSLTWTLSNTL